MQISFLGQPLLSFGGWTSNWLEGQLSSADVKTVHIAVAWMKRSGLSRLQQHLTSFRQQGGSAVAIIGIDEGGATRQGLELALEMFDSVYVFHDPASRTFHPKVYVASSSSSA